MVFSSQRIAAELPERRIMMIGVILGTSKVCLCALQQSRGETDSLRDRQFVCLSMSLRTSI
jgi:hypothetical protein